MACDELNANSLDIAVFVNYLLKLSNMHARIMTQTTVHKKYHKKDCMLQIPSLSFAIDKQTTYSKHPMQRLLLLFLSVSTLSNIISLFPLFLSLFPCFPPPFFSIFFLI
jgi:hypothetical protein